MTGNGACSTDLNSEEPGCCRWLTASPPRPIGTACRRRRCRSRTAPDPRSPHRAFADLPDRGAKSTRHDRGRRHSNQVARRTEHHRSSLQPDRVNVMQLGRRSASRSNPAAVLTPVAGSLIHDLRSDRRANPHWCSSYEKRTCPPVGRHSCCLPSALCLPHLPRTGH